MPAGTRWPRITFSFKPTSWSTLPAKAASVSTLVVSWKLAAEMKLALCTEALVMPSNCVLAVAGFGFAPLAGVAAEGLDLGVDLLDGVLGHDRARGEIAVALVGDLQALRQVLVVAGGTRSGPSRCPAAGRYRRRFRCALCGASGPR